MVEHLPSKQNTRVRFPSPAPPHLQAQTVLCAWTCSGVRPRELPGSGTVRRQRSGVTAHAPVFTGKDGKATRLSEAWQEQLKSIELTIDYQSCHAGLVNCRQRSRSAYS